MIAGYKTYVQNDGVVCFNLICLLCLYLNRNYFKVSFYEYTHNSLTLFANYQNILNIILLLTDRLTIRFLQITKKYIYLYIKFLLVTILPNRLLPLVRCKPAPPNIRKRCPESPLAIPAMPSSLARVLMLHVLSSSQSQ